PKNYTYWTGTEVAERVIEPEGTGSEVVLTTRVALTVKLDVPAAFPVNRTRATVKLPVGEPVVCNPFKVTVPATLSTRKAATASNGAAPPATPESWRVTTLGSKVSFN